LVLAGIQLVLADHGLGHRPLAGKRPRGAGGARHAGAPEVGAPTSDAKKVCPIVSPRVASASRSGWGMKPTTLPAGLQMPAMSRAEPLGLCGRSLPGTGT